MSLIACFPLFTRSPVFTQTATRAVHSTVTGPLGTFINTKAGSLRYDVPIGDASDAPSTLNPGIVYPSQLAGIETLVGYGWMFSHNIFYLPGDASFLVFRGNSQIDEFVRSNNSFVSSGDSTDVFERVGDNRYMLATYEGTRYFFDDASHPSVTRVEDRNGVGQSFEYTGDALTTIIDDNGFTFQLGYDGTRLTVLRESRGAYSRETHFTYDESGDLIQITDLLGNQTTFAYTAHLLNSIVTPADHALTIDYVDGKVTEMRMSDYRLALEYVDERTTLVSEDLGEELRSSRFAYDDMARITEIVDPLGNISRMEVG